MKLDPRWGLPADLLALLARRAARKPRPIQRAEYRARLVERATANHRRASAPRVGCNLIVPVGAPPNPPAVVSRIDAMQEASTDERPAPDAPAASEV